MLSQDTAVLYQQQQLTNLSYANKATAIAIVATILGLATSIFLYTSFGYTVTEKILYGSSGLVLSVTSIYSLPASYKLYQNQNIILSILIFAIYLSTVFIEYNTNLGFSALSQENVENHSTSATIALSLKNESAKNLDDLAIYSTLNLSDLSSQQRSLTSTLTALNQRLNACPVGYTKNCIKPTEQKIKTVEDELFAVKLDIDNATKYQYALNKKVTFYTDKKPVDIHPLFNIQSRLIGSTPKKTQAKFLAFSSFISTILASVLFLVSSALRQSIAVKVLSDVPNQKSWFLSKILSSFTDKTLSAGLAQPIIEENTTDNVDSVICEYSECNNSFIKTVAWKRFCCTDCKEKSYRLNNAI